MKIKFLNFEVLQCPQMSLVPLIKTNVSGSLAYTSETIETTSYVTTLSRPCIGWASFGSTKCLKLTAQLFSENVWAYSTSNCQVGNERQQKERYVYSIVWVWLFVISANWDTVDLHHILYTWVNKLTCSISFMFWIPDYLKKIIIYINKYKKFE